MTEINHAPEPLTPNITATATWDLSLWVECPDCKEEFDVIGDNAARALRARLDLVAFDVIKVMPEFPHDADAIKADVEDVVCPECNHEFTCKTEF